MATQASLPAALYLLSYDIDRQRLADRSKLGYLIRGAALTDLTLRQHLTDEDGRAKVSNPARTEDNVLDALLAEIGSDKPRKWKALVQRNQSQTYRLLEQELESARVITVERSTVLGLFPRKRILASSEEVQRLREMADQVLRGPRAVEAIDPFEAAVVSLAAAGSVRFVVSGKDKRKYKQRIAELTDRSGAAVPALKKVLQDIQAATAAGIAAAAAAGAAGN